jgi:hypothetical protein
MRLFELIHQQDAFTDHRADINYESNGLKNENSNGQVISTVKQSFDNFSRWFGDSEAVDSSGRPLVFFHGTKSDFNEFKVGIKTINATTFGEYELTRSAIFVTPIHEFAHDYSGEESGSNIISVYVKAQNPFDISNGMSGDQYDQVESVGFNPKYIHNLQNWWELFDGEDGDLFVSCLKKLGYDSVIFPETSPHSETDSNVYALFSGNQLKSVYGNKGTFNDTQNMTESVDMNRVKIIIDSMVLTILDPTLKGARRNDCYTFCAKAIRNDEVPDDAEFAIYGSGNHPAHGVIQKDGNILIDVFGNHRTMFKGGILKYKVEGHGMSEHPLTVVYKLPVSELKNMVIDKYKSIKNS